MQTVTIDDVSVAYMSAGSGPLVALLHCSASSAAQWGELAALLDARFNVIARDLYGCGGTGAWPGRRPLRLADHARMVAELLRAQCGPVHLVGHSFGGAVALRVAQDHPELLRSLTLIEPVLFHLLRHGAAGDRGHYAEIRSVAAAVFECTLNGHAHAGMARFVEYWNGPGAWARLSPGAQARLAAQIGGVAADFTAVFAEPCAASDYRAIAVPTLILRGSESPAPARRVAELAAAALPDSALSTTPKAGHMLPLTHAAAVAGQLAAHIDSRHRSAAAD
jgi:pimeloyl-ACP methyl ester carboxylesterase